MRIIRVRMIPVTSNTLNSVTDRPLCSRRLCSSDDSPTGKGIELAETTQVGGPGAPTPPYAYYIGMPSLLQNQTTPHPPHRTAQSPCNQTVC